MKLSVIRLFATIVFTASVHFTYAGKIDKGFKKLESFDYFQAKKCFEKSFKKYISPSAFGLATIYLRQDNPFHNIDSAYKYSRIADISFAQVKAKDLSKLAKYRFSAEGIRLLKNEVATYQFREISNSTSVAAWSQFLTLNPTALEVKRATFIRDSLALDIARQRNVSVEYFQFIEKYPNSELLELAKKEYENALFQEQTVGGTLEKYEMFLINYPQSPFASKSEDRIYELATEANTIESLNRFLVRYPKNRNREEAWQRLYQVYMFDYSEERIGQFKKEFPEYPFMVDLELDLVLEKTIFLPTKILDKFGAMNLSGELLIKPSYDLLGFFHEGLSLVGNNGVYGYINKSNKLVIPMSFASGTDFENGRAVVQVGEKYGMIDRTGKMILEPIYDDIGSFANGLVYAHLNGKYGYYDRFGALRIPSIFTEAYGFVNGVAKVQINDKQAFINVEGDYIVEPKYASIERLSGQCLIFEEQELLGLMNAALEVIQPATFEEVGAPSNGLAIVVKNGLYGYIDSLGKLVIPMIYEVFPNFMEKAQFRDFAAIAKLKGKFGLIDKAGKFTLPNQFLALGEFSPLIAFSKGKGWGFTNLLNKVEIQPQYDFAESFRNGGAIVTKGNLQGLIDISNKDIIPIQQESIERIDLARLLVKKNGLFGIFSSDGKVIVPQEYEEIRQLKNEFLVLIKKNEIEYLYLPENKLIRLN